MRYRLFAIGVLSLGMLAPGSWGQTPLDARACIEDSSSSPAKAVKSCTYAIDSGRLSTEDLFHVLLSRGTAYYLLRLYDHAIQDYTRAAQLNGAYEYVFSSRGLAYEMEGNFERAIQDYDQAIKLNPKMPGLYSLRASTQFKLGNYSAAKSDFAAALKQDPEKTFYPIWIYICAARSGLDARGELEKNAARINRKEWPGIVVDFFLGKVGQEAVLSATKNREAKREKARLGEAYFFLAERALIDGNRSEGMTLLQQSIDATGPESGEFLTAKVELRRLQHESH
jgi:lipoprotein NlpI